MAVLVSCQGASLNIRFVSAEGPWGGVDRVPFQSTALHHCFGAEMEWMRMDGEVAVTGTKENIFYCEKMTEKLLKNKKATCLSSSYRLETDDQIELHINSHFMPHAGNQFSLDTQFFFLPLYHPLPFFLHRGISGEGNLLHVMSAVHLTLHLHTTHSGFLQRTFRSSVEERALSHVSAAKEILRLNRFTKTGLNESVNKM